METLQTLKTRKSVRSYTGVLTDEELSAVLAAGQTSPVGMGKFDTVHMTVIRNKDLLSEIDLAGGEFFGDPERHPLYGAPCLILISTAIDNPAMSNVPCSNAAILAETLALAAIDMGLGSCLIWGCIAGLNAKPELVAKLGLPEGQTATCGIVLGETAEDLAVRDIPSDKIAVTYMD
ncbi:MAG: nitroreductase family protein [Clostridiales bacterium]|nr:nitroreductase family protein [Clostridiales bacterium]